MGKYLIRVESMDCDEKLPDKYTNGIEANGFTIIADGEDTAAIAVHAMSIEDISTCFANNKELLCAGILAKAKAEIRERHRRGKVEDLFSGLLSNMDD